MLSGNKVREEIEEVNLIEDSIDSWITCEKIGMQPAEFCKKELWFYKRDEKLSVIKHFKNIRIKQTGYFKKNCIKKL